MYLIDSFIGLFNLKWTQSSPQLRPLPAHIKRTYVSTPTGELELLVCEPQQATKSPQPPIFFAHGGFGSAGVWLDWMTYLHNHGYSGTLYAYSVRNHGASYTVPYWRMVFQTPFEDVQADMVACLEHIRTSAPTPRPPILVGHSSGGGLSQSVLAGVPKGEHLRTSASGLCLVDAIPSFGSYDIYANWMFRHDPWTIPRMYLHLFHPTSPLSTDRLVQSAFFGHRFPLVAAAEFRRWMPAYESMGWPMGMYGSNFWGWASGGQNTWLDCRGIVSRIVGAEESGDGEDKVCIIVGKEDMMYRPWMWEKQAAEYASALKTLRKGKSGTVMHRGAEQEKNKEIPEVSVISSGGVRTVLVDAAGHHVQNEIDELKYGAAEALLRWANQV